MPRPAIHLQPLPYVDALAARDPAAIDTVVLHCTELPDLATARAYGERVHYVPVNSCLQLLPTLDGKSLKTVESLQRADGPTALIAVARCVAASRLGEWAHVPDCLAPPPEAGG